MLPAERVLIVVVTLANTADEISDTRAASFRTRACCQSFEREAVELKFGGMSNYKDT